MNKAQVEFVTRIVTECGPGVGTEQAGDAALRLMQLARKAQRYNLLHCNVGLTPKQEKASEKVDQEVSDIAQTLGIKVKSQGDPRGYAIRVYLPSGMSNSFAGDGYGVPA